MGRARIRPSRETIGERTTTHGHTKGGHSLTYRSWAAMMNRCRNPKSPVFSKYGKIGISVCHRWRKFENFLSDMGERPSLEYSIDRYPNRTGNYSPKNCRWATRSEQCRNRKTSRPVERSDGLRFPTMIDAAELTNSNRKCIRDCCTGRQHSHLGYTWKFL